MKMDRLIRILSILLQREQLKSLVPGWYSVIRNGGSYGIPS